MSGREEGRSRCCPAGFPASLSHPLALSGDLRTPGISGLKCAASLRSCGPVSCLAKMLLTSSIWGSRKRSMTWRRQDTRPGCLFFRLAPSARGMSAAELLSWGLMFPTPLASDTGAWKDLGKVYLSPKGAFRKKRKRGSWTASLSETVYFLEGEMPVEFYINPEWVEWLMGFPKGWTAPGCGQGSRKEPRASNRMSRGVRSG